VHQDPADRNRAPFVALVVGLEPTTMPTTNDRFTYGPSQKLGSTIAPWRVFVRAALETLGGEAHLQALYAKVKEITPRARLTPTYQAKVRQVVQKVADFEHVAHGVWRLRSPASDASVDGTASPRS
jgi:hypothetical protein